MNNNEVQILRANIVGGMDNYIREVIGDDEISGYWFTYGMPDGEDEETLFGDMSDEEFFAEWCKVFAKCVKASVEED